MADFVIAERPDLVVNDVLDTTEQYIDRLKKDGIKVVNFEDLGAGARRADIVFNALYSEESGSDNVLSGPQYFCLRDEFLYFDINKRHDLKENIQKILVTFGGVDEANLTVRCIEEIAFICARRKISLTVIVGPGYTKLTELKSVIESVADVAIELIISTKRMSDFMAEADLAITSGGRTVLELASVNTPTVVICQNKRELTHSFLAAENGVRNLGLHSDVRQGEIGHVLNELLGKKGFSLRLEMVDKMKRFDLREGKKRVIESIRDLIR